MKKKKEEEQMASAVLTSPAGAVIGHGRGIEAVRQHIERAGDHARSLGATLVPMRQVADAYLHEVEEQHLGEGYEVIEEPQPEKPLVALSEQASVKACLERLADTPLLRKKAPAVHIVSDNLTMADAPALFAASEIALGFRPRPRALTLEDIGSSSFAEEPKKRSWWRK